MGSHRLVNILLMSQRCPLWCCCRCSLLLLLSNFKWCFGVGLAIRLFFIATPCSHHLLLLIYGRSFAGVLQTWLRTCGTHLFRLFRHIMGSPAAARWILTDRLCRIAKFLGLVCVPFTTPSLLRSDVGGCLKLLKLSVVKLHPGCLSAQNFTLWADSIFLTKRCHSSSVVLILAP